MHIVTLVRLYLQPGLTIIVTRAMNAVISKPLKILEQTIITTRIIIALVAHSARHRQGMSIVSASVPPRCRQIIIIITITTNISTIIMNIFVMNIVIMVTMKTLELLILLQLKLCQISVINDRPSIAALL